MLSCEKGVVHAYSPLLEKRSRKRITRKHLIPAFLVLFVGVIAVTVWLGIEFKESKNIAVEDESRDENKYFPEEVGASNSPMGTYRFASVSADDGRCSQIGTEMLAKCGSAVDAAIATMLCIGVVNCHSTGIGGGSFMTIYDRASQTPHTIDFREVAPLAAHETMFKGNSSLSTFGGLAIGVPGEVNGYWEAHRRFGKLPWKDLFAPTIKMCREGFEVENALAKAIKGKESIILQDESLSEIFVDKNTGNILIQGNTMYRPKLATTLETIANEGMNAFYNGSLSEDIVHEIQSRGGIITLEDLNTYAANASRKPLNVTIDNMTVYTIAPPSSGVLLQFMLNILDGYDFTEKSLSPEEAVLTYHRITEAFKFAYAKRTDLGDDAFEEISGLIRNLTSKHYAEEIRSKIWDNMTHSYEYYGPTFYDRYTVGTSHASVLAANGDAVAITSTINTHFGSKVRGIKTGILYNNEMDDFSSPNITNFFGIPPSPANFIKPGKRPLSSMSPSIFVDENGDVILVVGASGGTRITTSTTYVAIRALWFKETIKQAIDARRIHHQLLPPVLQYEDGFPKDIIEGLMKKGHNVSNSYSIGSSVVQGIRVLNGKIYANSDFRKGGYTDGY